MESETKALKIDVLLNFIQRSQGVCCNKRNNPCSLGFMPSMDCYTGKDQL